MNPETGEWRLGGAVIQGTIPPVKPVETPAQDSRPSKLRRQDSNTNLRRNAGSRDKLGKAKARLRLGTMRTAEALVSKKKLAQEINENVIKMKKLELEILDKTLKPVYTTLVVFNFFMFWVGVFLAVVGTTIIMQFDIALELGALIISIGVFLSLLSLLGAVAARSNHKLLLFVAYTLGLLPLYAAQVFIMGFMFIFASIPSEGENPTITDAREATQKMVQDKWREYSELANDGNYPDMREAMTEIQVRMLG